MLWWQSQGRSNSDGSGSIASCRNSASCLSAPHPLSPRGNLYASSIGSPIMEAFCGLAAFASVPHAARACDANLAQRLQPSPALDIQGTFRPKGTWQKKSKPGKAPPSSSKATSLPTERCENRKKGSTGPGTRRPTPACECPARLRALRLLSVCIAWHDMRRIRCWRTLSADVLTITETSFSGMNDLWPAKAAGPAGWDSMPNPSSRGHSSIRSEPGIAHLGALLHVAFAALPVRKQSNLFCVLHRRDESRFQAKSRGQVNRHPVLLSSRRRRSLTCLSSRAAQWDDGRTVSRNAQSRRSVPLQHGAHLSPLVHNSDAARQKVASLAGVADPDHPSSPRRSQKLQPIHCEAAAARHDWRALHAVLNRGLGAPRSPLADAKSAVVNPQAQLEPLDSTVDLLTMSPSKAQQHLKADRQRRQLSGRNNSRRSSLSKGEGHQGAENTRARATQELFLGSLLLANVGENSAPDMHNLHRGDLRQLREA